MANRSAIEKLYYMFKDTEEGWRMGAKCYPLLEKVMQCDDDFQEKAKEVPELFELHEKLTDALDALNGQIEKDIFVKGFRYGVLLGLEIAAKNDE